jgi:PAS domain S-box-containing protein
MFELNVGTSVSKMRGKLDALDRSQATIEFKLDGTILAANKNFLDTLGYSLAKVQGKHHSMFVDQAERSAPAYADFWAKLNRGEFQSAEYRRIGKGGKEVWIRASYNPILDSSGYADMMLSLGMDRFKPARVVEYIGDIHRSGQHLLAIVNDVLDLSRIEHDAFPVECASQSARSIFASAAELVRPLAQDKALDIKLATLVDDLKILCDARATCQCLLNLLSNAVKFSPAHDRIDVEIRRDGTHVAFVVRDYGPGMAPSALVQVGEPFLRVNNPKVSSHEGTGLGLSIVVKLAAMQGGRFEICNASMPGSGARHAMVAAFRNRQDRPSGRRNRITRYASPIGSRQAAATASAGSLPPHTTYWNAG